MAPYHHELSVALLAVQRAAILTQRVFHGAVQRSIDKDDRSPVTIGDFGAQALIISSLRHNFPADGIVAEEEASALRGRFPAVRDQVWGLVSSTRLGDDEAEASLGGPIRDVDTMLDLIDAGGGAGGPSGRFWTIDPIDGTKGFLRGGQYAICLALVEDGHVKVGVLGCPNLPVDDSLPLEKQGLQSGQSGQSDQSGRPDYPPSALGVVFSAVSGQGATSRPLGPGPISSSQGDRIAMRPLSDLSDGSFCESFEPSHSDHGLQADIAHELGIVRPSVRMDSQAKYGSIARGAGDIYLRIPVDTAYHEKIWDHAAGDLIVREAGGTVTDVRGDRLDFGAGRTLARSSGVVAASSASHARVLQAVRGVLDRRGRDAGSSGLQQDG